MHNLRGDLARAVRLYARTVTGRTVRFMHWLAAF